MDPQALTQLILDHKWFAVLALTIGFVVRMGKPDVVGPSLPSKWRAPVAIAVGITGGFVVPMLQKLAGGSAPKDALVWGLGAAFAAIAGHDIGIEGLRDGKEIPVPFLMKKKDASAGAIVTGIFAVCMLVVPAGMLATEEGCTPAEQAQIGVAINQIPGDVMDGITCVASVVTATQGPEDPIAIVSACSKFGVDLAGVYKIVSSWVSQSKSDAGAPEVSPQAAKLLRIQQNAKALLARGK